METIDTARFWLSQGVASVPLHFMSKVPAVKWTPYKSQLPTETIINLWYQEPRNIALVCGWMNLCVLDFDTPENYSCWFCWQLEHNREILNTYRTSTSRGVHVFFYLKEDVKITSIQHSLFEVKTGGKLVTIPPSVHSSGKPYHSLDDPQNVQVVSIEQVLNYSPVVFEPLVFPLRRSKYAPAEVFTDNPIEAIKSGVSLLSFFPNARKIDERYFITDCPFHGHKSNFWIDVQLNICGCYAFCVPVMNVVQLFMRLNDCDIKQAIKELSYLV